MKAKPRNMSSRRCPVAAISLIKTFQLTLAVGRPAAGAGWEAQPQAGAGAGLVSQAQLDEMTGAGAGAFAQPAQPLAVALATLGSQAVLASGAASDNTSAVALRFLE